MRLPYLVVELAILLPCADATQATTSEPAASPTPYLYSTPSPDPTPSPEATTSEPAASPTPYLYPTPSPDPTPSPEGTTLADTTLADTTTATSVTTLTSTTVTGTTLMGTTLTATTGTSTMTSSTTDTRTATTGTATTTTGTNTTTTGTSTMTSSTTLTSTTLTSTLTSVSGTNTTRTTLTGTTMTTWTGHAVLPAQAPRGSIELRVDSFEGFRIGDSVLVSGGGNSEVREIVDMLTINVLGSVLALDAPLQHSYPVGATVAPYVPTDAPTPAPPTAVAISAVETTLASALFASNETSLTTQRGGITTTVYKVEIPDVSNYTFNGTRVAAQVGPLSLPLSMFSSLGLAGGEPLVAAVSVLDDEAIAALSSGGGGEMPQSVMSINIISDLTGAKVDVSGLPEPIVFAMPGSNATGSALDCAFLDEPAGEWRADGVSVWGYEEDGNVICATLHLSFFGAMLSGLLSTLECSQASLLAEDSYKELFRSDWYTGLGAILLLSLMGMLLLIMLVGCYLDFRQRNSGYWRDEYFLLAASAAPDDSVDEAATQSGGGGLAGGLKSGVEDMVDTMLGSFCAYLGNIRSVCSEFMSIGCDCGRNLEKVPNRLVVGFLAKSVFRSSASSYFIHLDDMDLLFSEEMDELMNEDDGTAGEEGDAGESPNNQSPEPGAAPGDEAIVVIDHDAPSPSQAQAGGSGEQSPAAKSPTRAGVASPSSVATKLEGKCTIATMRQSSDLALARFECLKNLRRELVANKNKQLVRHSSCFYLAWTTVRSWLVHGPIGCVFITSITIPHATRALLLCVDLLGAAMLATVFASATGGSSSKRSPKACSATCEEQGFNDAECVGAKIGGLIAIGLASSLLAGIPLGVLSAMHERSFVRVAYEGSPCYHEQLRKWRQKDIVLWVVGVAYCLFAAHYVMLFFANVAAPDQDNFMISAGIGYFEDFVIIPFGVSFVISFLALSLVCYISIRHRLRPYDLVKHGDIAHLESVFENADDRTEVRDALLYEEGPQAWVQLKKAKSGELRRGSKDSASADNGLGLKGSANTDQPSSRGSASDEAGAGEPTVVGGSRDAGGAESPPTAQ